MTGKQRISHLRTPHIDGLPVRNGSSVVDSAKTEAALSIVAESEEEIVPGS